MLQEFSTQISNELGVKAPQKTAKRWVLSIAWRLDWLNYKIIGKKRKLTKNMCRTLNTKNYYSSSKFLKQEKGFKFTPISKTISELSQFFLKDVKTFQLKLFYLELFWWYQFYFVESF